MINPDLDAPSRLHARWSSLRRPHLALLDGPTPVRHLTDPGVWIKDDSRCAQLYGGNKVRKLEWSLAEVMAMQRKVVITAGGIGTNHGLATAVFARELGLDTVVLLVDQPETDEVMANYRAMQGAGARTVMAHTTKRAMAMVPLEMVRNIGVRAPWILPVGGSSASGVLGFVEGALELAEQVAAGELPEPDEVVLPVGSGGSAAGLLLGLRLAGLRTRVRGVLVNDKTRITADSVRRMATRSQRLLARSGADVPAVDLDGFELDPSELGDGYGHATASGAAATERFAAQGVTLDPVYTAKAAACLLARPVEGVGLLWHTFNAQPLPGAAP